MHKSLSFDARWQTYGMIVLAVGLNVSCRGSRTNLGEISPETTQCLHGASSDVSRTGTGTHLDPEIIRFTIDVDSAIATTLRRQKVAVEVLRGAAWWRAKEGLFGSQQLIECQVRDGVNLTVCGGFSKKRPNLFIAKSITDDQTRVECRIQ